MKRETAYQNAGSGTDVVSDALKLNSVTPRRLPYRYVLLHYCSIHGWVIPEQESQKKKRERRRKERTMEAHHSPKAPFGTRS